MAARPHPAAIDPMADPAPHAELADRVTRVETHLQYLATKDDVSALGAELRQELAADFAAQEVKIAEGFAAQEVKMVGGFAAQEVKMAERLASQDLKIAEGFAAQDLKITEGFAAQEKVIHDRARRQVWSLVAILTTVNVGILGLLALVLTLSGNV